ncbi:MAG: RNA polymerase sigma factor [Dehalococcoidia bacterium]
MAEELDVTLANPEAFRAFYEDALPRVYAYVFHRCGGIVPVAEDLTQETFLAAVTEIKRGKAIADPLAWILGVAKHKLLDHYRRQERQERKLAMSREAHHSDAQFFTGNEEGWHDQALATLGSIPVSQRAALVLRYLDDMSVPEVARAIGRSVRATESLLARGRENFKRLYLEVADG